jgi:hypothetical protein
MILEGRPRAHVPSTSHDFGVMEPQSEQTQLFELHNQGTTTLHIKDVKAG